MGQMCQSIMADAERNWADVSVPNNLKFLCLSVCPKQSRQIHVCMQIHAARPWAKVTSGQS